jgi:hypothetical protein
MPVVQTVPVVLYKYFPPERISVLENMEIRFSRPSEFNDAFDTDYLVPISQGSAAKAERLRLRNKLGIFCLTERADNHLMWVHYAQNHTGFVLGFSAGASFFRDNNRVLDKVSYRNRPKVFGQADVNVCFYKSDKWRYEREWRCVRSFELSESRVVGIEPGLISQIILGSQMEPWQIARIVQYASAYEMKDVQFFRSFPSRKSWTFENKRKIMSVCTKCAGDGYLAEDPKATDQ